jgi:hypothetical protein
MPDLRLALSFAEFLILATKVRLKNHQFFVKYTCFEAFAGGDCTQVLFN